MKKILMSMVALFALCGGAAAQRVEVADVEALPGETVSLVMQLDTESGSYTGLEFDIQFPQEGFETPGTGSTVAEWDGTLTIGPVGGVEIENLSRCGILSYSDTPIPGEGLQDLCSVNFSVDNGLALGDYTITLMNMTLIGDTRVPVSETTFTLHVVSVHTVILDENSTTVPDEAENVNVRVNRTLKAGVWSTICLPFAMTEAQVKEAFGEDVELGDFQGTDPEFDGDNVIAITANFDIVTAIEANHPYIIKAASAITNFIVDDVNITPDEDEAYIEFDNGKTGSRRVVYSGFYGTYHANTELEKNTLFLNNNKFWYSTGKTKMKGYRAYFDFLDILTEVEESAAPSITLSFDGKDGDVTKIDGRTMEQLETGRVYNTAGQYVGESENINQLPKGVYIVNGKKKVIK